MKVRLALVAGSPHVPNDGIAVYRIPYLDVRTLLQMRVDGVYLLAVHQFMLHNHIVSVTLGGWLRRIVSDFNDLPGAYGMDLLTFYAIHIYARMGLA
jgi:hypothetical protein